MTISTDFNLSYYIFGNLTFALRGIKSPANQLCVKQFIQDNIKAPHYYHFMCGNQYWPLVPLPNGPVMLQVSPCPDIIMNSVTVLLILKTYLFRNRQYPQVSSIQFLDSVDKNICRLPYRNSIVMEDE